MHSFVQSGTDRCGRPFKSVRLIFEADITGGELGTLEVGGSTDFAEWVPLVRTPDLAPRADIVSVAFDELTRHRRV